MYSTTDFRRGLKIEWEGIPYEIVEFQHVKPGKGGAFIRTKLRNILNGRVVENTFRSGEKVGRPDLASQEMQFLYHEGPDFVFMDMESYEQVHVSGETIGDKGGFLKDGQVIKVLLYNGQVLDLDLPVAIALKVVETEPGVQGDRVGNATKPAKMETGITIQVPLFIGEGEIIRVDTRTNQYISRD